MNTVISLQDRKLEEAEARIEEAERNAYYSRGLALAEIRDEELWKQRFQQYTSFREYCEDRWELKESQVYRLMDAALFAAKLPRGGVPLPSNERHIRPLLARLDQDEDRIIVWRDVLATTNGAKIRTNDVDDAISRFLGLRDKEFVTLDEWRELDPVGRTAILSRIGKAHLNEQKDKTDIEWAGWSWNPVTGCLHGCPYCYARDIAFNIYPSEVGFGSTIWPNRLTAPANQKPPVSDNVADKNIFTCSMADLFGRWVPDEWIEKVLETVSLNPQWNFLFLTKFPKRMAEFSIPPNAWMGTTVDLQARVANAERAFENVKSSIRWLSIEPMIEPLKFSKLDIFDWIVIGGSSASKGTDGTPATPDWTPPLDWIVDLHQQARAAGCKIYYKTNSGLSGVSRLREFPGHTTQPVTAPDVFNYLSNISPKEQVG